MSTPDRTIAYWSGRVDQFRHSRVESGAGHPIAIARLIHEIEIRTALQALKLSGTETLIDIGAGGGRWSVSLAPRVSKVIALEPSELFSVLRENTARSHNIECRKESCAEYSGCAIADLAIVSGVMMYLDDNHAAAFASQISRVLKAGGKLMLREPVSARGHERYSNGTDPAHSSYWEFLRKKSWYSTVFARNGMKLTHSQVAHAPLLYYLPRGFPFPKPISKTSLKLAETESLWPLIWQYNRLVRKPYERQQDLFGKRSMRILVFIKNST
jgi:SAM-dependent methyltransferase